VEEQHFWEECILRRALVFSREYSEEREDHQEKNGKPRRSQRLLGDTVNLLYFMFLIGTVPITSYI